MYDKGYKAMGGDRTPNANACDILDGECIQASAARTEMVRRQLVRVLVYKVVSRGHVTALGLRI